ncbi:GPI transamidase component [Wickerhamomyces ciferrii]|uniref:GPI transamidase component n=1 Tax=Wickerhamomyces ciferrii (strain ATCC 14091 / BCRC 22168 / CBS 111 / JCM 3599 / NBRC 0793 / NRRL Y-1031 F-60-10) TaxID=1206466 RepID=K0KF31_WICCF|nr:GPI transamidase component [Wickerhamomyces ciferrii]CCH40817.1 GPI transamidase component [Wickerhamomyces ciferrii]
MNEEVERPAVLDKAERVKQIIHSETRESLSTRRYVVLSILALYFLIGFPLWMKLTEIYRAPLPSNFINMLQANQNIDLKIHREVFVKINDGLYFPDLAESTQIQIDHEIFKMNQDPNEQLIVDWNVTLRFDEPGPDDYILELEIGDGEGIAVDPSTRLTVLYYTLSSIKNNDLPYFITQTVLYHIFNSELEFFKIKNQQKNNKAINYSPKVHLSFKLLTGDGDLVDWKINEALDIFFQPIVETFQNYVNFTIDSEIKYFTELNLVNSSNAITLKDLSTIVDFSEWDISSNNFNYPTLNFVLYYPSKSVSPLNFEFDSSKNAFLFPQWGSLILQKESLKPNSVLNEHELRPIFEKFTSELITLLGLPKHPKTLQIRLDAIKVYSIFTNLIRGTDSLSSLLKLSKSLPNMSIPKTVLKNVQNALKARENTIKSANYDKDWDRALIESNKMLEYSELAFFDREMVQQSFFPQEHKVAVYLPLLGPLSIVCFLGIFRIISEIKLFRYARP